MDKELKIDVVRLKDEGETFEGVLDDALYALNDRYLAPFAGLRYTLFAQRIASELLVRGKLEQDFTAACSRCGADFDFTVHVPDFLVSVEVDENLEIADLTNDLRESIILALPTYPVCRDDCRGICAMCGQNLNTGSCSCVREDSDSRWDALDNLKKGEQ
jgi:uncharacterized protein